jgi:glycosyltransferase involved in cell wall biosynthesis
MIHVYYIPSPEKDRWFYGDRFIRPLVRRIIRGKPIPGGNDRVFLNLIEGFKRINYPYTVNSEIKKRKHGDRILLLGRGSHSLTRIPHLPFVAGIGVFTHPNEYPEFHLEYPILAYLSSSEWANDVYKPYFGDICKIWPSGIDTELYKPYSQKEKNNDFLIYDKLNFNHPAEINRILNPILKLLNEKGLTYEIIRYGSYKPDDYQKLIQRSKYYLFLSPHESQGLACQQAMACGLPVLAMDEGIIRDPYFIKMGSKDISVSSVPWFNSKCGRTFKSIDKFEETLDIFLKESKQDLYQPQDYIKKDFSLEASALKLIEIMNEAYNKVQD